MKSSSHGADFCRCSSGVVLETVCEYFLYNERNRDAKDAPEMDIPVELALELVIAVDYLDSRLQTFIIRASALCWLTCAVV